MPISFQTLSEKEFGLGMDKVSAENQIKPGFTEDLVNIDTGSPGILQKRKGYQGVGGNLPFRVVQYTESAERNEVCFLLDIPVSLSALGNRPIIVAGKTSIPSNQFSTETTHYYPEIDIDIRVNFQSGTNTISYPQAVHSLPSPYLFVGVAASTSGSNFSNSHILPNSISINKSTYEISVGYTNNSTPFSGFVFAADKQNEIGLSYQGSVTTPDVDQVIAAGTNTYVVPQSVHQLSNNLIGTRILKDTGIAYEHIEADEVTISPNGDVSFTFINNDAPFNARFVLSSVPDGNSETGTMAPSQISTISFSSPDNAFVLPYIYLEDLNTNILTKILPNSITYDTETQTCSVEFVNNTLDDANFYIFYETVNVLLNKVCVPNVTISSDVSDMRPQLTLWGLTHEDVYSTYSGPYAGWVQHLDSYKSAGERFLVAGLGGNLYTQRFQDEAGIQYLMPTLYPRLLNRIDVPLKIGPAFIGNVLPYVRTKGTIQFTGGDDHLARASSITWVSGNQVMYTLEMPGLTVNGTLSDILTVNEDYLTVSKAGYKRNEGEFKIVDVSVGTDQLLVTVENPNINSADWNEVDSGAQCGVYTDRLTFLNVSEFIPGDKLSASAFGPESDVEVLNSTSSYTLIKNVYNEMTVPSGQRVVASRVSKVVPLRTAENVATVENLLIGDMVQYVDANRLIRIQGINIAENENISVVGNSFEGQALVTATTSGFTENLMVGEEVILVQAGEFAGPRVVTEIISPTEFKIEATSNATASGFILGKTITIDERLSYTDSVANRKTFSVSSRWIPVEAPETTAELPAKTHILHFDSNEYTHQSPLRSTMVQDSLFLTNGDDEVSKFDGVNVYRAGLPRWQAGLFAVVDYNTPTIVVKDNEITVNTIPNSGQDRVFHIPAVDIPLFAAGDRISHNGNLYTIERVDTINNHLIVTQSIDVSGGINSIFFASRYKYYFRLNAVDRNNNIVVSATTGADDNNVIMLKSASVNLRLVGFPAWEIYDYDRLEVEIYRTKVNTVGPFYRLSTIPLNFDNNKGYVDYVDTSSDDELINLDNAISVLKGQELAPGLNIPLRSKYITSAGNRLVLANVAEYNKLDIVIEGTSTATGDAELIGRRWLFRRDNIDTGTVTDMVNRIGVSVTATSTPITALTTPDANTLRVESAAHGRAVGDWVYLYRSTAWPFSLNTPQTAYCGWFQIAAVTTDTFDIAYPDVPAVTATTVDRWVSAANKDIPVLLGNDYNYTQENANFLASDRQIFMRRMANALNTAMRMTNVTISGQEAFVPWLIANAGSEYGAGQILIEQPKATTTFLECVLPSGPLAFQIFVNGTKASPGSQVQSIQRQFPSRLLASYSNYPEVFDSTGVSVDANSDSVVDVNSADGQQITGIIPFFGDSAFGSSQKDSIIVVFKTNSIYLVNLEAKRQGLAAVQKIDSQGLGCTYPYSIANTREGIIFANEAGIYRLTRNLTVDYVGRMIERYWDESVSKTELNLVQGHNYALGRQYKLSFPLVDETANSTVLVYDHTQEYDTQNNLGGWTKFTNHPATGWANLDDQAYFASTKGRVFVLRNAGDVSDFRDDDQPIHAEITFRALNFGDAAIRKYVSKIILHLRTPVDALGTKFYVSTDLRDNFQELDDFIIDVEDTTNGLSDVGRSKIGSIKFSTSRSKFLYLQNRLINDSIDEGLEVTSIEYRVAGLPDTGLTDAARTKK